MEQSIIEAYGLYKTFHKNDQYNNLHDPWYLIDKGYVKDTKLMRILAKDIIFCHYTFEKITNVNYHVSDVLDYDKLRQILLYEYGLNMNVENYLINHRLNRLMQYVDKHITQEYIEHLTSREQSESLLQKEIFEIIISCCDGIPPRLDSNPVFTNIDFKKVNYLLYSKYNIILSIFERRQLNTVRDIINHLIIRFRDGGRINSLNKNIDNEQR